MNNNKEPFQQIAFSVFTEIGIITQLVKTHIEEVLPLNLKESQFGVLNHFMRMGDGVNPNQLAQAFQVTKAAMTNNLSRLETKGLVKIKPDKTDGRAKKVFITAKGRKIHTQAVSDMAERFAFITEEFSMEEFMQAGRFLETLRLSLDNKR